MTYRAIRVLSEVNRIACEDTRVTRKLCDHYGIGTQLMRHDANNEAASTEGILSLLAAGESVALVTDAGTPGISDPGVRLVAAAVRDGHRVVPIPGASSIVTALSASGLPGHHFTFYGFISKRAAERRELFSTMPSGTHAFFCPARDLSVVLGDLITVLPDVQTVVGREITKVHETWYRGLAREVHASLADADKPKGEAVVLLYRRPADGAVTDLDIAEALRPLLGGGVRVKEAAREVADALNVPKRRCYQLALKLGKAAEE
jgi:16S rRNA (cytidine1402-2'-O)-methyltransferase